MRPIPIAVIASIILVGHIARAEEEKKEETKEEAKEEEAKGLVDLETVIGGGKVEALNPDPTSTVVNGQLRYERALTNVIAAGIVLSGRYDVSRNVNLGIRLPLAVASLMPDNDVSRTSANFGNIEVEVEYERELSEHVEIFFGAHVALPTSAGNELPSEETLAGSQVSINPVSADQYAINHAVSSAYGDENTALWLAGYIGLVPAAGVKLKFGRVRIEPYVKVENMFSVRSDAQERAVSELVAGGRIAVRIVEGKVGFDLGVRAWGSFTLTDHEGNLNIGVVEPEVRVGNDRWRVTAGLLVPFTGELADLGWISGRLSASVVF